MHLFTKYYKKMTLVYIASAMVICLAMLFVFPWFRTIDSKTGYYLVVINDVEIGAAKTAGEAEDAYLNARLRLETEEGTLLYLDTDFSIYEQSKLVGTRIEASELEDKIYDVIKESEVQAEQPAYMIDIDGYSITLASKDDVIKLLEAAKSKYDVDNVFHADLIESDNSEFTSISYNMVKGGTEAKEGNIVLASGQTEDSVAAAKVNINDESDKLEGLAFGENISIVESYVSSDKIMSVEDAIAEVTKEKETNQVYEVQIGDSLYKIAKNHNLTLDELLAMNTSLSETDTITPGDELIVTVPEPELSVITTESKTYEENYTLPVQTVYDDSKFTTYSKVITQGSEGYRKVTANVSYKNGTEIARDITNEVVITEAVAQVVMVGTQTPPTYIKPLSGGRISSYYGQRWGRLHGGVDWATPIGTAIKASCGGTVINAGWSGSYGYSILIQHPDGKQTRYAHLSKILVKVGQKVTQGEKIGLSGNTGNSTGPHLHFEIIVNGNRVNPLKYL